MFGMDTYSDSDGDLSKTTSDTDSSIEPTITEFQERYSQLRERYVTLKAMTETLKEQLTTEKEQLTKELQATKEMEAQLKKRHVCKSERSILGLDEYRKKTELFQDFLLYQKSNENLEDIVMRKNYRNWLCEVESKCNMELMKIKENMIILKPLKDMAARWPQTERTEKSKFAEYVNRWQTEEFSHATADTGAAGDKPPPITEASLPEKETNMSMEIGDS